MLEPYWAWWVAPLWLTTGGLSGWAVAAINRPRRVECPNCGKLGPVKEFKLHWKVCLD